MYDQDVAVRLHIAVAADDGSIKVTFFVSKLHIVGFGVFDIVTEQIGSRAGYTSQIVVGPFRLKGS